MIFSYLPGQHRQIQLWSGSFVCCYFLKYEFSVIYSDQYIFVTSILWLRKFLPPSNSLWEQVLQQFRDQHLPKYTLADFELGDSLEVKDVSVVNQSPFKEKNILYSRTFYENVTYDEKTSINEVHIDHHPFVTKISISNPNKVVKKVILRIWFGLEFGNG